MLVYSDAADIFAADLADGTARLTDERPRPASTPSIAATPVTTPGPEKPDRLSHGSARITSLRLEVPAAVTRLLTADVAREIAATFGDQPLYPERIFVDSPASPGRRFPGWPGPVLVLSDENQGVCSWGVPLGGSGTQVLVGGDLLDAGRATVRYAASIRDFIEARRWDHACLSPPVLQAQAAELDQASLGYLRERLTPAVATAGWPGPAQYRFDGQDVRVMLWSTSGQCDWWISGSNESALKVFTEGLLSLSDLRSALWSNDDAGAELLGDLRSVSR